MTDSAGHEIIHDKEPIRLFKSNFLEFFTHIHPAVVAIIWIPVLVYFMYIAIRDHLAAAPGEEGRSVRHYSSTASIMHNRCVKHVW